MQEIEYTKDSFSTYLGKKDFISASDAKNFARSPMYYYYKKYGKVAKKTTSTKKEVVGRHFVLGSALHECILEPHEFFKNYVVAPEMNRRTKDGKAEFAEFNSKNKDKSIILDSEMDSLVKMCESALKNKTLIDLMQNSAREVSIYTIDEPTGLKIKLRPDVMCDDETTIIDIKTAKDGSPKGFKRDAITYGYPITDAFYKHFANREDYIFCAVEKTEPHQISLYRIDDAMCEIGKRTFRMALDLLKWSYENEYWCNYNEFELLKECYELEQLNNFFNIKDNSPHITLLK
jgi:exodeoxyribonuclease VIII